MLVDMSSVTQCMVVSSALSSPRLPINHNAADGIKILGRMYRDISHR